MAAKEEMEHTAELKEQGVAYYQDIFSISQFFIHFNVYIALIFFGVLFKSYMV